MEERWMAGQGVSLDDLGLGKAYVLGRNQGEHTPVNKGIRTLLTRAVDTHEDLSIMVSSGDESAPTMPHYHVHTTETVYVLSGVVRVWLDDQNGNRLTKDLKEGEFGLLPRGWIHSWAFAAPNSRHFGVIAPGGFERIVDFLDPNEPTSLDRLRESEKAIDVKWMPDYPLFELCAESIEQNFAASKRK